MPDNFFDTSALGKHYHNEVGTPEVDAILAAAGSRHVISRLGAVEVLSVFAGKVRTGTITVADFEKLRRRFFTELTNRVFQAVRMSGFHFQEAQRLVRKHGPAHRLRTLDALQLAVALDLRAHGAINQFICADKGLLAVAAVEGLVVVDPERP
ncbi:MAG TPA: type II toxin-antitoxin system VapC family toxin [Pirellulales bacterium]|nr:type II toxin-antitoxin system VapC family toxin [Pirellulales bacterium]